ncbi:MAG: hypothetical protein P4K94_00510 [Terracidiphilus sp.]|nr:hypothetical protein [Terracidiphilus sp.]
MFRKIAFSFALILPVAAAAKAADFPIEIKHAFTTEQGLPDNQINCIAATTSTVYAGTAHGLSRFDGDKWLPVNGLTRDPVEQCAALGDSLYVVNQRGLQRVSAATVTPAASIPAGRPLALAANGKALYIAMDTGLYRANADVAKFTRVNLPAGAKDIRQIAVSPAGELAVAASDGLFVMNPTGNWRTEYPQEGPRSWAPKDVRAVAFDSDGRLWFASPQGAGYRDATGWKLFTGAEGLPFDDFTTIAAGERGVVWFGTSLGAIRFDGKTWEYRQGLGWLPDDGVRAIAVSASGNAWFATAKGVGLIERKPTTFAEKARYYEDEIDKRHHRTPYGYVTSVQLPIAGDKSKWVQYDNDNDGLWTSMYGAGECFAYAATRDPLAKQRARKAFEALRFLSQVTQGGEHPAPPGFPARSILPTSGPDPNLHDSKEHDLKTRSTRDHLWKILSPRWPKSADGKWYWKTDTSSDELDGHYFFYAQYYDLVAETPQEKDDVRQVVRAITDHLLEHNFSLVDWDGTPTRWAVFDPVTINDAPDHWSDRGLNSLSILSYLKVAEHMTGDPKYAQAYRKLITEDKYAMNMMVAKLSGGQGSGNHSDDEMAFMSYYDLIKYETDDKLLPRYAYSLANYYRGVQPELNPFFNFVAAYSLRGKKASDPFQTIDLTLTGNWLEDSLDTLRRLQLDRVDWKHTNSHRKDIIPVRSLTPDDDDRENVGYRVDGRVLPVDEGFFDFWNHDPYSLDTGGDGHDLGDGAVFLLPYYMGLYHGFIE